MNVLTTFSLLTVVVAAVLADGQSYTRRQPRDFYSASTKRAPGYGSPPGYEPKKASGYAPTPGYRPKKASGYDSTPGYESRKDSGYGPTPGYEPKKPSSYGPTRGYGPKKPSSYGPPSGYGKGYGSPVKAIVPFKFDKEADALDKLFFRIESAQAQIKFLSEIVDVQAARLSLAQKFVDEFLLVTYVALEETDQIQYNLIESLWEHLRDLMKDIKELAIHVNDLFVKNQWNVENQEKAENLWAAKRRIDVKQDRDIFTVYAAVRDFKRKLFQVKRNYFATFNNTVGLATVRLDSIKTQENRRMCETGRVTLTKDDLRVEYSYNTLFVAVPHILFGLCGFSFDLDASDNNRAGYGYGYGYNPYFKQPEAIGGRVMGYSTKSTATFIGVQLSFGDTMAKSADVCFQACSFDAGTGGVIHQ